MTNDGYSTLASIAPMLLVMLVMVWPIAKILTRSTGVSVRKGLLVSFLLIVFLPIGLWVLATMPWPAKDNK